MERWLVLKNQDTTTCTIYNISGPKMAKNGGPLTAVSQERFEFGASVLHFGLCACEASTLHNATPMLPLFSMRAQVPKTLLRDKPTQKFELKTAF